MKLFYFFIVLFVVTSCSFDKKSGIWTDENDISDSKLFKDFKVITTKNSSFDKEIQIKKNFKFKQIQRINNYDWKDIFYDNTNNYKNFTYNDNNQIIFESKKISRQKINYHTLIENNNLIGSDHKGNIIVFSINDNKIIQKFNFYKKKYKKNNKSLNLIVEKGVIYVSDNLGYFYAYNYYQDKIIWAKNYKTPFRSNLKLFKNKLVLSNQNNALLFVNKKNGDILKLIPTEEITIKNKFKNNLSLNKDSVFFLNTYGSLYSLDAETMRVNWFLSLNQSFDLNPSNLFNGSVIVNNDNIVAVSSNHFTYIIDANRGKVLFKINFSSIIKPIIAKNYFFLITKNNLLIAMDLNSGEVIYSYNVNKQISKLLNTKKKSVKFKNMFLVNNHIYVFLKNSLFLKYDINGNLEKVEKLPRKIYSHPMFIDNSMIYVSDNKKISMLD